MEEWEGKNGNWRKGNGGVEWKGEVKRKKESSEKEKIEKVGETVDSGAVSVMFWYAGSCVTGCLKTQGRKQWVKFGSSPGLLIRCIKSFPLFVPVSWSAQ